MSLSISNFDPFSTTLFLLLELCQCHANDSKNKLSFAYPLFMNHELITLVLRVGSTLLINHSALKNGEGNTVNPSGSIR